MKIILEIIWSLRKGMIKVCTYDSSHKSDWNDFVRNSKNGFFLFERSYMDYHTDRFSDNSLLIFRDNKLLALLPANRVENILYSHQGLTYGGLILSKDSKLINTIEVFKEILKYCKNVDVERIVYKAIPPIYHSIPGEEDLFALYNLKATLISRSASVVIKPGNKVKYPKGRKAMIGRGRKNDILVEETDDFSLFYDMMESLLENKYGAKPTHSLQEMEALKKDHPANIKLFTATKVKLLAGVIIFESNNVAHFQYISTSKEGRDIGALDVLTDKIITEYYSTKPYLDFGTSNDDGMYGVNENLLKNKESYGGRSVMQDVYELRVE
jgi:hypothetical protein